MAEEPKDKLALRIVQRRKQAEEAARAKGEQQVTPSPVVASAVTAESTAAAITPQAVESAAQFQTETNSLTFFAPQVVALKIALASDSNPLAVAEMLAAILAAGVKRKDLLPEIGKSAGWLSKRLGLLEAPKDIRRLIESGALSESEYYDNRQNVKAGIVGRGETVRYNRVPTVSVSIDAAKSLAAILKIIAEKNGAAPIRLDANPSKKDLTNILNLRAGEIKGLLK
jgi:hypothetical protein